MALAGAAALLLGGMAAVPAQAATAGRTLAVENVAFAQPQVDATPGEVTNTLSWTVTDSDPDATDVTGAVVIRRALPDGRLTGPSYEETFSYQPDSYYQTSAVDGSAQSSTYGWDFPVPQYSGTASATWRVVKVTAKDDRGADVTVGSAQLLQQALPFTASELVDATSPTYTLTRADYLPTVYNDAASDVQLTYSIDVEDAESGFQTGKVTLSGPGGATASGAFTLVTDVNGETCGPDSPNWGTNEVICSVTVTVPAGSPAGTWSVSKVRIKDNAGNVTTDARLSLLPVRLTQNATLQATGFSLTPGQVNNWPNPVKLAVGMTPTGVRDGLTSVTVATDTGCGGSVTAAPQPAADGSISVPAIMFQAYDRECAVTGIELEDGAGDVAAYGPAFGGSDLGLVTTQVPDTSPPVLSSVSLSPTSIAASDLPAGVTVSAHVSSWAGVNGYRLTVYDADFNVVAGGSYGGLSTITDGPLTLSTGFSPGTPPGVYYIGFSVTDWGDLDAMYGYPNRGGSPAPGAGLLKVTITA